MLGDEANCQLNYAFVFLWKAPKIAAFQNANVSRIS